MNKDSSRHAVMEVVEIIANYIALQSHYTELYQNKITDLSNPDLFTEEDIVKLQDEAADFWTERTEVLNKRRAAMRILKSMAVDCDEQRWCEMKHKIWVYQFTQELVDTDPDNEEYINLAEESYASMVKTLSQFLWVEIATCWRCILDSLQWKDG